MPKYATIDIGSNALRLLIAEITPNKKPILLESIRESVRLGHDSFSTGKIGTETQKQLLIALKDFAKKIQKEKAILLRSVATSALRDAKNSAEILAHIKRETNLPIEIISGDEEARLVFTAVKNSLRLPQKPCALIDIGGGSVEVSIIRDQTLVASDSLKLGTVRLLELFKSTKEDPKKLQLAITQHISAMAFNLKAKFKSGPLSLAIGTGGNFEALRVLKTKLKLSGPQNTLTLKQLDIIFRTLAGLTTKQRMKKLELRADRADVILPALIVVQSLMQMLGYKTLKVAGVGLKEGILFDEATRLNQTNTAIKLSLKEHREEISEYALDLGRRMYFEEAHARCVATHATRLFEQTRRLHKLPRSLEPLLYVAALLHDVGHIINSTGHHKPSCYILRNGRFPGVTKEEQLMVANVARYHRKNFPTLAHEHFKLLSPEARSIVRKLSALLRIADAADRTHTHATKNISLNMRNKKCTIKLSGRGNLQNERWAIERKADLFASEFKTKVVVV